MNKFFCEPLVKAGQAAAKGVSWTDYNNTFIQGRWSQILIWKSADMID